MQFAINTAHMQPPHHKTHPITYPSRTHGTEQSPIKNTTNQIIFKALPKTIVTA